MRRVRDRLTVQAMLRSDLETLGSSSCTRQFARLRNASHSYYLRQRLCRSLDLADESSCQEFLCSGSFVLSTYGEGYVDATDIARCQVRPRSRSGEVGV